MHHSALAGAEEISASGDNVLMVVAFEEANPFRTKIQPLEPKTVMLPSKGPAVELATELQPVPEIPKPHHRRHGVLYRLFHPRKRVSF